MIMTDKGDIVVTTKQVTVLGFMPNTKQGRERGQEVGENDDQDMRPEAHKHSI